MPHLAAAIGLTTGFKPGQAAPVQKQTRPRIWIAWAISISFTLFCAIRSGAETPCFRLEGLKYVETVHLDVTGARASGEYLVDEYGENGKQYRFSGNVVPTPKGKNGVYLTIRFNKEDLEEGQQAPYQLPPGTERIVWVLRIVNHHAHLFISKNEKFYDTVPAHYAVAEDEYQPCK
jgi:hypothetical protein